MMKSKNLFINKINNALKVHSPELLIGMGVSGFILTVVDTVRATVKSIKDIEDYKYYNRPNQFEPLTKKEIVKIVWKNYIPVAIGLVSSSSCVVWSNHLSNKRNALLAASYAVSETALSNYREYTKKVLGTEKEKAIAKEVQEKVEAKTNSKEVFLMDDDDTALFKEPITGQYFKSTWNNILAAVNRLNASALSDDGYITLNRYLFEIGCEEQKFGGEDNGWYIGSSKLISLTLSSCVGPNSKPALTYYFNYDATDIRNR